MNGMYDMYGILWSVLYFIILYDLVWSCIVLLSFLWSSTVFYGPAWPYMILMVVYGLVKEKNAKDFPKECLNPVNL